MARILMADDDPRMIDFVRLILELEGHHLIAAQNGQMALESFVAHQPDLVLLDIMMPGMSGMEVCSRLRELDPLVPILFLSAKQQVTDRIQGLHQGADDYIIKPFNRQELLARVESAWRRSQAIRKQTGITKRERQVDGLLLNADSRQAIYHASPLVLSRTEFDLLWILCEYADRVLEREFLFEQVWGYASDSQSRTVDNFAGRLRKKLQAIQQTKQLSHPTIESVYGVGYRLTSSSQNN